MQKMVQGEVSQPKQSDGKKPWYKSCLGMAIAILFWPVFLIWYAWAKSKWSQNTKVAVTVVCSLVLLFAFFISPNTDTTSVNTPAETQTNTTPVSGSVTKEEVKETKPEETKITSPEPIVIQGRGQKVSDKLKLTKGLTIFKMSHSGGSNWAPVLLNSEGAHIELLANEIGAFEGSKAVQIRNEGEYVIDITADGNWVFTVEQPRDTNVAEVKELKDKGQRATNLFKLTKGLRVFKMHHDGDSNWAPVLLDAEGNHIELLANEIGKFDGEKAVRIPSDGAYLIDVAASGNWTITME